MSSMVEYSSASDFHSDLLASQSFTVIVILVPRFYLRKRMAKLGSFVYCGLRMRLVSGYPVLHMLLAPASKP